MSSGQLRDIRTALLLGLSSVERRLSLSSDDAADAAASPADRLACLAPVLDGLEASGHLRILRRLVPDRIDPEAVARGPGIKVGVIVDVETTGLDHPHAHRAVPALPRVRSSFSSPPRATPAGGGRMRTVGHLWRRGLARLRLFGRLASPRGDALLALTDEFEAGDSALRVLLERDGRDTADVPGFDRHAGSLHLQRSPLRRFQKRGGSGDQDFPGLTLVELDSIRLETGRGRGFTS